MSQSQPLTEPDHKPRKKKGRLARTLLIVLSSILVLALVATGFVVWTVNRSFPQASGTIEVPGLGQDVTVQRDDRGIPTITAKTSADLFYAQGYVHAQDRFWEMDFRRHLTSARLSELFGESQLGTDKFLRTLGWRHIAEQEVAALPEQDLAHYQAYADGVNAYLAEHKGAELSLEYAVLGLQNSAYAPEDWQPADSVAWFKAMAWDLRTNIEDETTRALMAPGLKGDQLASLYPGYPFDEHPVIVDADWSAMRDKVGTEATQTASVANAELSELRDLLAQVDALVSGQGEGIGSNSWVVSGEHTTTGQPLLANDPHLGAALPSVWNQQILRCETVSDACPFNVSGFSFSGLPGIVIGHNEDVAWGFTNLTTDVADLYIERVDGDQVWADGEQYPIETRTETIKVAGGEDVTLEIRSTKHGPIISGLTSDFTDIAKNPALGLKQWETSAVTGSDIKLPTDVPAGDYEVALRWTALDAGTTGQAIFTLNTAKNFADFQLAASQFDVPAQNLIYADTSGNIGYQAPGRLPIRGAGDGWLPQPGWDSAYDWQGFIPFADQPNLYNPDAGYIVTANNAIVRDDYPYFLSRDWDYGYRAARIVELLEAKMAAGPVSAQDLADIHMDNQSPAGPALKEAFEGLTVDDADVQKAVDLLAGWDAQNSMDSGAAAYANVLWNNVTLQMVKGFDVTVPRDDQSRYALIFENMVKDPDSEFWAGDRTGFLTTAAKDAYTDIVAAQGKNPDKWNWGQLHAITLTNDTFGTSGIAPIEWLFNRGPFNTPGGSGVVNATGWSLDSGSYATTTVPSFRTVMDVSNWDASTWQHLTGASGHAFHKNYTDQTKDWAVGKQYPWAFSKDATDKTASKTLILTPKK